MDEQKKASLTAEADGIIEAVSYTHLNSKKQENGRLAPSAFLYDIEKGEGKCCLDHKHFCLMSS